MLVVSLLTIVTTHQLVVELLQLRLITVGQLPIIVAHQLVAVGQLPITVAHQLVVVGHTTDNSGSSSTGGGSTTTTTDNSGSSSTGGSAGNSATLPTTSTAGDNTGNAQLQSNSTNSTKIPPYCRTCDDVIYKGTGDFASMILAGHNRERAALGVAPLVWNNEMAARAQDWVNYNLAHGTFTHCVFVKGWQQIESCTHHEGENGAASNLSYPTPQREHVTYQPRCRRVGSPKIPPIIGCR